jgi:hypothetical protein
MKMIRGVSRNAGSIDPVCVKPKLDLNIPEMLRREDRDE